jgi:hypothetical protein
MEGVICRAPERRGAWGGRPCPGNRTVQGHRSTRAEARLASVSPSVFYWTVSWRLRVLSSFPLAPRSSLRSLPPRPATSSYRTPPPRSHARAMTRRTRSARCCSRPRCTTTVCCWRTARTAPTPRTAPTLRTVRGREVEAATLQRQLRSRPDEGKRRRRQRPHQQPRRRRLHHRNGTPTPPPPAGVVWLGCQVKTPREFS